MLVAAVERATANFVERGQQIAAENPEIQRDMMEAVQAVQATGDAMSLAAREFAADPCSSVKRGSMVSFLFTLLGDSNLGFPASNRFFPGQYYLPPAASKINVYSFFKLH